MIMDKGKEKTKNRKTSLQLREMIKTEQPRFARGNQPYPFTYYCTPFALRALPSVGGSFARNKEKISKLICF